MTYEGTFPNIVAIGLANVAIKPNALSQYLKNLCRRWDKYLPYMRFLIHLQIVIDQVAALSFLNKFSETSADVREKIMIQTELEEAGFDSATVNKVSV